ncbi:LysR substrate-binding domain-containing protein [Ruegeria sp. Ofav3-42]|uniref:LysR substrate-binding domain-containing protein n=1 Tax=Ruegeria sp. Ofav3-42 TaxID=2917759 RepID=UPI001EF57BEC|nr:LysR substrate-binding domain-containing protein [Ruegeria sp. Ofav3-42]MCG7522482.1 LysR substrate-binding domain-containing protein [Ruegeria sp. Ofav3-42]
MFHHHDLLRLFVETARYPSFSEAAEALNMTKGAISYQVKTLEADLGMVLFRRTSRGVRLTGEGLKLLAACQSRYEEIEAELNALKGVSSQTLTVGVSTYFAARWLSPRLMSFMQEHQDVQLRIQPMVQFSEREMQDVDLAIKWGNGEWDDGVVTPFMPMPTFPVGNSDAARLVEALGIKGAISHFTLLRDRDDSNAWSDWLNTAGLKQQSRRDVLIVPDPNVRVQAVIDGQGIALMDDLVDNELQSGKLVRLSDAELSDYGYFLVRPRRVAQTVTAQIFSDWLQNQP